MAQIKDAINRHLVDKTNLF